LKNAPTSDEMQELLKSEDFRHKVAEYIQVNLRAHLQGLDSAEAIKSIPNKVEIAYLHPPHPDSVNYDDNLKFGLLAQSKSTLVNSVAAFFGIRRVRCNLHESARQTTVAISSSHILGISFRIF